MDEICDLSSTWDCRLSNKNVAISPSFDMQFHDLFFSSLQRRQRRSKLKSGWDLLMVFFLFLSQ